MRKPIGPDVTWKVERVSVDELERVWNELVSAGWTVNDVADLGADYTVVAYRKLDRELGSPAG